MTTPTVHSFQITYVDRMFVTCLSYVYILARLYHGLTSFGIRLHVTLQWLHSVHTSNLEYLVYSVKTLN